MDENGTENEAERPRLAWLSAPRTALWITAAVVTLIAIAVAVGFNIGSSGSSRWAFVVAGALVAVTVGDETFETWVPAAALADVPNMEQLGRVLLSSGQIVKSQLNEDVRRWATWPGQGAGSTRNGVRPQPHPVL
jgi:hypothetical protein